MNPRIAQAPGAPGPVGSGLDGLAGRIVVSVDPLARPYLDRFRFSGQGWGRAPAPEIHVEPVGALW